MSIAGVAQTTTYNTTTNLLSRQTNVAMVI